MPNPRYAMVSYGIRRDLLEPLRHFTKLELTHYYRTASYGDLRQSDMSETLCQYHHAQDLYHKLWQLHPEIIQGPEVLSLRLLPITWASYLAAKRLGIPLILPVFENRPLHIKYNPSVAALLHLSLRPVLRYASLFFPQNQGARRTLVNYGVDESQMSPKLYGTWGVNLDEFTPSKDGSELNLGQRPVLLYVGRLHAEKGVFDILGAYTTIKASYPQALLVFVGDGPAREELQARLVGVSYQKDVHFTGVIKHHDVPVYMRSADILLSPSVTTRKWAEQVGMTNLQAMACALPVISTRSGAIPQYMPDGEAGILVPERDPQALAEAVLALLDQPERRKSMGLFGREYAIQHYDAQRNVQKIQDILCHLLQDESMAVPKGD